MDDPTALDYWTLAIAVLGALTGLAALGAQVWSFVLSGPRVRVGLTRAVLGSDGSEWLSVESANIGRLPVTVVDVGATFRVGRKRWNVPFIGLPHGASIGRELAHRLPDAESETWLLRPANVAAVAAKNGAPRDARIRGYVRLATGRTLRSRRRNAPRLVELAQRD